MFFEFVDQIVSIKIVGDSRNYSHAVICNVPYDTHNAMLVKMAAPMMKTWSTWNVMMRFDYIFRIVTIIAMSKSGWGL